MIPERFRQPCDFCGQTLDTRAKGVHQWTAGWVEQRAAGGGHAISMPVRENRWAHGPCVRAAAPADLQLALF
jgi:hypothetical protein